MDTQAQSAIKTTFATLEEAADNLREALKIAEQFNRKLRGSYPQEMNKCESPEPTLQNLAQEIFILSREVRAEVDSHHSVLGNSRSWQCASDAWRST